MTFEIDDIPFHARRHGVDDWYWDDYIHKEKRVKKKGVSSDTRSFLVSPSISRVPSRGSSEKDGCSVIVNRKSPRVPCDAMKYDPSLLNWRTGEHHRTVAGALCLCLNIGVDPPDVVKPQPCARTEAWIDPSSGAPSKMIEAIGNQLQTQYTNWQARARYKQLLDPTVDDIKKALMTLRKSTRHERILFHYNGHGVPRPTTNGEIWVFNKTFTQYIPLSLYDLQTWLLSPAFFVWDCASAGTIVHAFNAFAEQRQRQLRAGDVPALDPTMDHSAWALITDCIHIAACAPNEQLPQSPQLPADLLTCCLTTPVEMALKYHLLQHPPIAGVTLDMIDRLPGKLIERRTPLGELNWILTAILDTIAWTSFRRDVFLAHFRNDVMLATMLRHFLLAERILRTYGCTPSVSPPLPPTHQHPLWEYWDMMADLFLRQLPSLIDQQQQQQQQQQSSSTPSLSTLTLSSSVDFFHDQLTSFRLWLAQPVPDKSQAKHLPILLQVLLSPQHRLCAMELLAAYMDHGPACILLALNIGVFPYVLKLLTSPATDLRPPLMHVWSSILAVDRHCQSELLKESNSYAYKYFLYVLGTAGHTMPTQTRTHAAFVLASLCYRSSAGSLVLWRAGLEETALRVLAAEQDSITSSTTSRHGQSLLLLRFWTLLALATMYESSMHAPPAANGLALVEGSVFSQLCALTSDGYPDVRAAALYVLSCLMVHCHRQQPQHAYLPVMADLLLQRSRSDPAWIVRRESLMGMAVFLSLNEKQDEEEEEREDNAVLEAPLSTVPVVLVAKETTARWSPWQRWLRKLRLTGNSSHSSNSSHRHESPLTQQHVSVTVTTPTIHTSMTTQTTLTSPMAEVARALQRACDDPQGEVSDWARVAVARLQEQRVLLTEPSEDVPSLSLLYDEYAGMFCEPIHMRERVDALSDRWDGTRTGLERRWRASHRVAHSHEEEQGDNNSRCCYPVIRKMRWKERRMESVVLHDTEPWMVVAERGGMHHVMHVNGDVMASMRVDAARTSALHLLHPQQSAAVLLTVAHDGVVRVLRQLHTQPEMVASWSLGMARSAITMVRERTLYAMQESVLTVYDLGRETRLKETRLRTGGGAVSCLASVDNHVLLCGTTSGALLSLDTRTDMIKPVYQVEGGSVGVVQVEARAVNRWMCAYSDGGMQSLDVAGTSVVVQRVPWVASHVQRCVFHPVLRHAAVASVEQGVRVLSDEGALIASYRPPEGLFGQKTNGISALAFHPSQPYMVIGTKKGDLVMMGHQDRVDLSWS